MSYWYWYRQAGSDRVDAWVLIGPHESYEGAESARSRDKLDGEVTAQFSAATKEEAEARPRFL